MKTSVLLISLSLMALMIFVFANNSKDLNANFAGPGSFEYPEQVKSVIDNKCYGCHSADSKNQDAKDALLWDDLPELEKKKQIAALDGIIETLEEGTMPPEKAIKKYPSLKMSEEDKETLLKWAEKTADDLMK